MVQTVRKAIQVILPDVQVGWCNFDTPDSHPKYGDTYKINAHYPRDEIGVLAEKIAPALKQAKAQALKEWKGKTIPDAFEDDAEALLEDKFVEANEKERLGDYIRFGLKGKKGVSKKTKRPYNIRPSAWDINRKPLDADSVKLTRESVVMPVIEIAYYLPDKPKKWPKNEPWPALVSIKLKGVVIVALKDWDSGGALQGDFDADAIAQKYDIDPDDTGLEDFAKKKDGPVDADESEVFDEGDPGVDDDDEVSDEDIFGS